MSLSFASPARGLLITAAVLAACAASAHELKRTVNPAASIPIATAVTVPAGSNLVFFSGVLPDVANADAPKGTPEAYGDTQAQAASVLKKLKANLAAEGLGFGDVVQVRVFLVGDPQKDNKLDFAGLNAAFVQHFGTAEQPGRPARTALQVVALPAPGALVEIDLIAARPVHEAGPDPKTAPKR
jgi:enamine deaminase RidA (YjgF/YER057c/UK114 family)